MDTSEIEGFISDEDMEKLSDKPTPKKKKEAPVAGFISDEDMEELTGQPTPKGFISDEEMEGLQNKPDTSALEAGTKGAAQGAMLGFYDETLGAFNAGIEKLKQSVGPEVANSPSFAKLYTQERDAIRTELKNLQEKHPVAFTTGEVAGGVAGLLIPGGVAAKAAGAVAKGLIAKSAISGAAAGVGYSEADDVIGLTKDAAMGATVGAAFAGAGRAISKGAKVVGDKYVKPYLNIKELKDLGFYSKGLQKLGPEKQEQLAKFARDNKIITTNRQKTLENAKNLHEVALEELKAFRTVNKGVQFVDKPKLVKDLTTLQGEYAKELQSGGKSLIKKTIVDVENTPDDLSAMIEVKKLIGDFTPAAGAKGEAANRMYGIISDNVEETLEKEAKKLGDSALAETFKQTNKIYHLSKNLADAAYSAANRGENVFGALRSQMIGAAAGAAVGYHIDPKLGIGVFALKHAARKLGPTLASKLRGALQGPSAQVAADLVKQGKFSRLTTLLTVRGLATDAQEEKETNKKSRKEVLNQLKQPE